MDHGDSSSQQRLKSEATPEWMNNWFMSRSSRPFTRGGRPCIFAVKEMEVEKREPRIIVP